MSRLAAERQTRGLTQAEVAAQIGVARSTYVAYEHNTRRPPVNVAIRLSTLFDIPVEELFAKEVS